jgi:hypothetical protein
MKPSFSSVPRRPRKLSERRSRNATRVGDEYCGGPYPSRLDFTALRHISASAIQGIFEPSCAIFWGVEDQLS